MGPSKCPSRSSENYSKPRTNRDVGVSSSDYFEERDTSGNVLASFLTPMFKKNQQCYLI